MRKHHRIVIAVAIIVLMFLAINQLLTRAHMWFSYRKLKPENQERMEIDSISGQDAVRHMNRRSALFLDIRPESDHISSHIPGARSIPYRQFLRQPYQMLNSNRNNVYIVYDENKNLLKPRLIASLLKRSNLEHVFVLEGGFAEWIKGGNPVETGEIR